MKKINYLWAIALFGLATTTNAQIVSLGFEDGDTSYADPDSASFAEFYGDHINLYSGDVWTEKSTDSYTGSYALEAINDDNVGNYWDRGFKLRNLQISDNTSYRVSFYVKANATYTTSDGTTGSTAIRSSLSIGQENLDAPFLSPDGKEFVNTWTGVTTGDWKRFSYVSYFINKENMDEYFDNYSGNRYSITDGDTLYQYDIYSEFPDKYFLTINMYSPGTYILDNIVVEEATLAGCNYNYDFIQIDFGYATNIATIAADETVQLPVECVKVMDGDTELEVSTVEAKSDGYVYIFMADETALEGDVENIRVSFTPADDCPILYSATKRPSADTDSDMIVLAFEDEPIYLDETLDVLPAAWDAPKLVSTDPEDDSFELVSSELTTITFTYNKELDLSTTSVTISNNGITTDLTDAISLSDDGCSIIISVSNLADGEYTLVVSGVANSFGIACVSDQEIEFQVGESSDDTTSETVYDDSEFATADGGTFPKGWISNDGVTVHQYGLNDDGSVWDYDWGATPGGGGCRMMAGYSGDFSGSAIYWRAIESNVGTLTFGEQVNDYILPDGSIDPDMDEDLALYLEPGKYQVSFRMAAWKLIDDEYPVFDFVLEDLDGNEYARFSDLVAQPNVNGATGITVSGTTLESAEFSVGTEGYYVMSFSAQSNGGYHEYLLGAVEIITMPSKAAYYKQLLNEALDSANIVLTAGADDVYNGDTKTALQALVEEANSAHYTAPSVVSEVISNLYSLATALAIRIGYIDAYDVAITEAKTAIETLDGTKYINDDTYEEYATLVNDYAEIDCTTLSDDELNEVTPKLINAAEIFTNLSGVCDALAYRVTVAAATARTLGVQDESVILQGEACTIDDSELAEQLNELNKIALYTIIVEQGEVSDDYKTTITSETETDEEGNYVTTTSGVDFQGYINNPNFYTYSTVYSDALTNETLPGWEIEGAIHIQSGYAATETTKPVVDAILNSYNNTYNVWQSVSGLPVGLYDVYFRTRTSAGCIGTNDETGIPDMFIWASVEEGDTIRKGYTEGSSWSGHPTAISGITIDEDDVVSIGAKEEYVSGKSVDSSTGEDLGAWNCNTFVDDARFIFVAPLEGYDYQAALDALSTTIQSVGGSTAEIVGYEYYSLSGIQLPKATRGINIVKVLHADGVVEIKKVIAK